MKGLLYGGILVQILISWLFYQLGANELSQIFTYLAYILTFAALGKLILKAKISTYHRVFSILTTFLLINGVFIFIFYYVNYIFDHDDGGLLFLYEFPIAAILVVLGLAWIITTIVMKRKG